ncbi:MAG: hypothetical protein DSY81_08710 [Bacillota bacterium]|nr:MAG: hypothetical protein DSY92_02755 [Planctomycetota bacterium]RUA08663.1 MAG: hypothetical protein DSY81_08710 [Bacillota bacterium]
MQSTDRFDPIVGDSEAIHDLRTFVLDMSVESGSVLLSGAPGVGKRLAARKIHAAGSFPGSRLKFVHGPDFCIDDLHASCDEIPALVQLGTVYIGSAQLLSDELARNLVNLIQTNSAGIPRIILGIDLVSDGAVRFSASSPLSELEICGSFSIPALRERPEDISAISRYQIWASSRPEDFEDRWKQFTLTMLGEVLARPWHGNVPELLEAVTAFCSSESKRSGTALLGNLTESVSAHWLQEQIDRMHENLLERWGFEDSLQGGEARDARRSLR